MASLLTEAVAAPASATRVVLGAVIPIVAASAHVLGHLERAPPGPAPWPGGKLKREPGIVKRLETGCSRGHWQAPRVTAVHRSDAASLKHGMHAYPGMAVLACMHCVSCGHSVRVARLQPKIRWLRKTVDGGDIRGVSKGCRTHTSGLVGAS